MRIEISRICFCRTKQKAEDLCKALGQGSEVADLESVCSGAVSGDVLLNTTSIGMQPDVDKTPVPKEALEAYKLVFDAVYTPVETKLLKVHACPSSMFIVTNKTYGNGSGRSYKGCTQDSFASSKIGRAGKSIDLLST